MKRLIVGLGLSSACLWAQVGAPLLGYVPDGARLRPVYGIPAAASAAGALDYGRDFARLSVSPRQDYAIASDASTGEVVLVVGTAIAPLPGAAAAPDRIVESPRGASALLWFAASRRLQVISGLPASPLIREVDLAFLGEPPAALAVSDDGGLAAGVWGDGVYSFGPHGELARIPMRERVFALAFYSGSHDLAAATRADVFTIADLGGGASVSTAHQSGSLAPGRSRAGSPVGMALSSDNRWLVVAESSGSLLTLDLASGAASRTDCGCAPEGVFLMSAPAVFRVTSFDGAIFKLFDAAAGHVLFVPLSASEGGLQ